MKLTAMWSVGLAALIAPQLSAQPIVAEDGSGTQFQLEEDGYYGRVVEDGEGTRYLLRSDGSWEEAGAASGSPEAAEEEQMDEEVRELESASPPTLGGAALTAELERSVEDFVARRDPDADEEEQSEAARCLMDFLRPFEDSEKRMLIGQPTLDAAFDLWADEGQPGMQDEIEREIDACTS